MGGTHRFSDIAEIYASRSVLRFCTMGSVDDGKSSLIGRLLYDSKSIFEDHLKQLHRLNKATQDDIDLALVTDGLRDERAQGITIDVAYRYFSTPRRNFIIADTPGHEQYTRNMVTGASTSNLAVLVVDARKGIVTQTKRHAFIAALLGIPRLLIAVNKMDLVDYSEEVFCGIEREFVAFAAKLDIDNLKFIPVVALHGDNIVTTSHNTPWYEGESVLSYLENVYVRGDTNLVDFRFPVQYVICGNSGYRGYAGQIVSGTLKQGDELLALPSGLKSKVRAINLMGTPASSTGGSEAFAPQSVAISLEDEIDVARGDILVRPGNRPLHASRFESMLVWMGNEPLELDKVYLLQHGTRLVRTKIDVIHYRVDVNTLGRVDSETLKVNDIGRVRLYSLQPIFIDSYKKNRVTGAFILIDPLTFATLAGGMILDRLPAGILEHEDRKRELQQRGELLHSELGRVSFAERKERLGFQPLTIWLTGLSASGKSSIASMLERRLFDCNFGVQRLDGDNLRGGLNRDLGFSSKDRAENIRRAAEIARLMNEAGLVVVCAFISPLREMRETAKTIVGEESFIEVHIDTPLVECKRRDPHGLYRLAEKGEIKKFTGIDAPYEAPVNPALRVVTENCSVWESSDVIVKFLNERTGFSRLRSSRPPVGSS